MRHRWPEGIVFTPKVLVPADRVCPCCGRHRHIGDQRRHPFYTLAGPLELLCKLVHCPDKACPDHARTHSPLAETSLALPGWLIGWDVFCWIGHRHAGVRLVQQGATLLAALDAHRGHEGLFTEEDLQPYRNAQAPPCQQEALHRRKVMRKARSKKKRLHLLADLEHRYGAAP